MLYYCYTIYDTKSLTYSPPFFDVAHGSASRKVSDAAQDPNTNLARHPRDFTLYCVGQYNDATGQLLPNDVREHIADVVSLLPRPEAIPGGLFPDGLQPGSASGGRPPEMNFEEPARFPVK